MKEAVEAFPLHWPIGFERSKTKKYSQFQCTLSQARDGVLEEIRRLKGVNVIISSNIPVKQDGNMYGHGRTVNGDEGVAVYFTWKNDQYVLACDNYYKIHENLRAIQKTIEAIRGIERWGASDLLSRAFSGFKQLAESTIPFKAWYDVLGVNQNSNYNAITDSYRLLIKKYHPDNPETGDREMFDDIQSAYSYYKDTL